VIATPNGELPMVMVLLTVPAAVSITLTVPAAWLVT